MANYFGYIMASYLAAALVFCCYIMHVLRQHRLVIVQLRAELSYVAQP